MAKQHSTEAKTAQLSAGFNLIGTVLSWVKEYGGFNMFMSCAFLIFCAFTIRVVYEPEIIYQHYQEGAKKAHAEELREQHELDIRVKALLPKLLASSKADRAWIFNYHNGTSTGEHGTMRFEECQDTVTGIKDQYTNIPLSGLRLPDYLRTLNTPIFMGSIEDLRKIDKVLAERLTQNGIYYLACIALSDEEGIQTGVLGFTGSCDPILLHKEHTIHDNLIRYGATIEQYVK